MFFKMEKENALRIVFVISVIGILFSGFLSYEEIFRKSCAIGGCSYVLGFPACVYGFFMYLIVFIVSLSGLYSRNGKKKRR